MVRPRGWALKRGVTHSTPIVHKPEIAAGTNTRPDGGVVTQRTANPRTRVRAPVWPPFYDHANHGHTIRMREIILDTETTGLYHDKGDRVVEIGCIELEKRVPTGKVLHYYFNPERDMPADAFAVHGLSIKFLADKPRFSDVVEQIQKFIGDAQIVAHNAEFDLGFLNAELKLCGRPEISRNRLVDTLMLARRKHPGSHNKLDDLCTRYKIDNSKRVKHGALLDAELLAEIYVELVDAKQGSLLFDAAPMTAAESAVATSARPVSLAPRVTDEDRAAHRKFIETIKPAKGEEVIWNEYLAA